MERVAAAAGHADRTVPLKNYCTGLLLPGERKSVEPMAARLAPENVRRMHQSLHHLVADAAWSDAEVLRQVRNYALTAMQKKGPVVCWVVDDTGFPKKGSHSVGVTRQYCGQVGKQENCRVAVSLSIATWTSSLPIAWRLYLPEIWASDPKKRKQAGVPEEIRFETKPQIALGQIRQAVEEGVAPGVVVADAGYGVDGRFRKGITELNLEYVVVCSRR
jgi:SRSO17 transposase